MGLNTISKLPHIDAGNWRHYLNEADIEREHVLDSYGYKTIRLNKFNIEKRSTDVNELLEQALRSSRAW